MVSSTNIIICDHSIRKEDLPVTEMFQSSKADATFFPVFYKMINSYVHQSAQVMRSMDPLLDVFLFFIKSLIQVQFKQRKEMVHVSGAKKRHCSLSILTFGSVHSEANGFFNEIHMDKGDILKGDFAQIALRELANFKERYASDALVQSHIEYLSNLYNLCGGFPIPTVCGYRFSPMAGADTCRQEVASEENFHAHFPMPGIGSSVRLRCGTYHFFLGGVFSHCTSVPVTIEEKLKSDGSRGLTYTLFCKDGSNVVAWGAGSKSGSTVWGNFVNDNFQEDDQELEENPRPINNRALVDWLRVPENNQRLVPQRMEGEGNVAPANDVGEHAAAQPMTMGQAAINAGVRGSVGAYNEVQALFAQRREAQDNIVRNALAAARGSEEGGGSSSAEE